MFKKEQFATRQSFNFQSMFSLQIQCGQTALPKSDNENTRSLVFLKYVSLQKTYLG